MCVSAASKSPEAATTVAPLFIIAMMFFAGFIISFDQMAPWIGWLSYLSFSKYGYQALMLTEYYKLDLPCMHDFFLRCDPLGDFDSPQDTQTSLMALGIMYVVLTFISYLILKAVSKHDD